MPELPEVETVRRGLEKVLPGSRIVSVTLHRDDLRLPFTPGMAKTLKGKRIERVERRSKYLLFYLGGKDVLLAHLGMTGSFTWREEGSPLRKHDHVLFHLDNGKELAYHDPRRFGLMLLVDEADLPTHPLLASLGPEPFSEDFSAEYLQAALMRRSGPVKPALMDASLVVGVGNIYACEALFRTGIHPETPSPVAARKVLVLRDAIRRVLQEAIDSGGSTLRDYTNAEGLGGSFQHFHYVYGRAGKPCRVCETSIIKWTMAGRGTYACPTCQTRSKRKPRNASKPKR